MCGIAGFISARDDDASREAALARMLEAQLHRGPDDGGLISRGPATLGMRRLAIFDPANGRQPMSSPDGRHHLVFNGALYNFRELRPGYAARGWVFHTDCDTEVLLAALALDGESALPALRGMFAFAWWDATERTLLLARDALGVKPLYYYTDTAGRLLFASEIRALRASRAVPGDIDPAAAADFLRRLAIPAPRTLHRAIKALRPGESLRWREGRATVAAWWTPARFLAATRPARGGRAADASALRAELREKLESTIRAHAAADVPVGAFLSGGLDSAVVTALMARHSGPSLKTFSIGFEESGYSELAEAAATARHLGVTHHARVLTGADVARDLEKILAALDAPTGDGINTYYAARLAREGGVTVALSGLGADELFGGYPSFRRLPRLSRWAPVWARTPGPLRHALLSAARHGGTSARQLSTSLRAMGSPARLALAQREVFSLPDLERLLGSSSVDLLAPHPAETELAAAWDDALAARTPDDAPSFDLLASLAETRGYMAEVLLRDSDEFSMRHSLELRVPFVDLPLAEWAWAQTPGLLYPPGAAPKASLAAACADLLPPGLLARKKQGFTLPFARWLRGPLRPFMEDTLTGPAAGKCGLIDPRHAEKLWRAYRDGGDDRAWSRVWSLAVLIHLLNRG